MRQVHDIDRVGSDVRLLRFLEEAAALGRIVLASANGTQQMLGALLRPGRFDEVVSYERLDRGLLEDMLVELPDSEPARPERTPSLVMAPASTLLASVGRTPR